MLSPNVGKTYALEIPVIQRKWTGITFGSLRYPNPLGQEANNEGAREGGQCYEGYLTASDAG